MKLSAGYTKRTVSHGVGSLETGPGPLVLPSRCCMFKSLLSVAVSAEPPASSIAVVVVVVVGPYRVFDGGVFANRLFKITGRRSTLSILCHELARAAKRIFRRKPLSHRK